MTPQAIGLFARYNRTMNERCYGAAARLAPAELAADRGAFFGSILGTLNHIAVADTIWLKRFAAHFAGSAALAAMATFEQPASLRQALAADLDALGRYRQRLDDVIDRWAAELTSEHLATTLAYTSMAGATSSKPLGAVLQHFFNHQTHHRGQVSTLLFQAGIDVGVTDLITLVPDTAA